MASTLPLCESSTPFDPARCSSLPNNLRHAVNDELVLFDASVGQKPRVVERGQDEELAARLPAEGLEEQHERGGLVVGVHVLVKLVHRPERRRRQLPHGQHQRQGGEGLLAAGQGAERGRGAAGGVVAVGTDFGLERITFVVKRERAAQRAVRQVPAEVLDCLPAVGLDGAPVELVPLVQGRLDAGRRGTHRCHAVSVHLDRRLSLAQLVHQRGVRGAARVGAAGFAFGLLERSLQLRQLLLESLGRRRRADRLGCAVCHVAGLRACRSIGEERLHARSHPGRRVALDLGGDHRSAHRGRRTLDRLPVLVQHGRGCLQALVESAVSVGSAQDAPERADIGLGCLEHTERGRHSLGRDRGRSLLLGLLAHQPFDLAVHLIQIGAERAESVVHLIHERRARRHRQRPIGSLGARGGGGPLAARLLLGAPGRLLLPGRSLG
mmetsp:Transcript_30948/g.98863  ORF Transcript_30948/g.98863 Transcript_30948/m.98863 type:complete len:438 (+) Transcript_30948:247-1560(+)|eukprot:scaffold1487_cov116-Isochrysis_galbana.AAC.11